MSQKQAGTSLDNRHIIMIKPVSTGDNKKGDRLMKKKLRVMTQRVQTRNLQLLLRIPTGRELKKQLT